MPPLLMMTFFARQCKLPSNGERDPRSGAVPCRVRQPEGHAASAMRRGRGKGAADQHEDGMGLRLIHLASSGVTEPARASIAPETRQ